MKKILQEPLLHFMLFGALIYISSVFFGGLNKTQGERITVSAGRIKHLETLFTKTWQRPPSSSELKHIVDEFILEQVAYREGVALGLDKDDTVITRRIRQKLDFIAQDSGSSDLITDEILKDYLESHPDKFILEPRLTVRQVFIDPTRHQTDLTQYSQTILKRLSDGLALDIVSLGDEGVFEPRYHAKTPNELSRIFGRKFSQAIMDLQPESWQGPIQSSYGVHLVYIEQHTEGRLPPLEKIRHLVMLEWNSSQRDKRLRAYYDDLLSRYRVVIQWPNANEQG